MRDMIFSLGLLHREIGPQGQLQNSIPKASGLSLSSLKHKQKLKWKGCTDHRGQK